MKIKLNNKKHNIKSSENLTVKEYSMLVKKGNFNIIDYLAVVTGKKFADISKLKIKTNVVRKISAYIGQMIPFDRFANENMSADALNFRGEIIERKSLDWETVGVRIMLETKGQATTNAIELIIYNLAIMLNENKGYDSGEVEKTYNELLEMNYIDVLSFAVFFFNKFQNGCNKGNKSLRVMLTVLITSIVRKLKKLKMGG